MLVLFRHRCSSWGWDPLPSRADSFLWLISREAGGAVHSHSLSGEHMSGPICHWLLWEWHQWWPPDPGWRRDAPPIGFHYERGEGARTPDGCAEKGEMENWKRHLDPYLTSCVSVFRSSLTQKWGLCHFCGPSVTAQEKAITEDEAGIITPTHVACIHFFFLSVCFFMCACTSVLLTVSGEVQIKGKLLQRQVWHVSHLAGMQRFIQIWAELSWHQGVFIQEHCMRSTGSTRSMRSTRSTRSMRSTRTQMNEFSANCSSVLLMNTTLWHCVVY